MIPHFTEQFYIQMRKVSNEVSNEVRNQENNSLQVSVSPLPMTDVGYISYTLADDADVTVDLVSTLGNVTRIVSNAKKSRGFNDEVFSIQDKLLNGSYTVRISVVYSSGKVTLNTKQLLVIH